MMKKLTFSSHDFGMFDGDLNGHDYEFFLKHTGAFKRLMKDEPREQKQKFLDAFCEFFLNHGEMKAISSVADQKRKFVESFRQYALETFIEGKFSAAKQFLNDAVVVAKNKHMIQYMNSQSYSKDPFFHKETRDVFRRLFGEPSEPGTCIKVICLLPMYVKFAGAICRYLRRWLDADETSAVTAPPKSSSKSQKAKKKEEEEKSKEDDTPAVMVFKIDRGGVSEIRRTPSGGHKITRVDDPAYLAAAGFPWPQIVDPYDEYSYIGEDLDLRRQRRREERMNREYEWRRERSREAEMDRIRREKIEEAKRAAKHSEVIAVIGDQVLRSNPVSKNSESKESGKKSDVCENSGSKNGKGKTSDGKISEGKTSVEKISEERTSEAKTPEDETSVEKVSDGKTSEEKTSKGKKSEGKKSEGKTSDGKSSDDKSSEEKQKTPEEKNCLESGETVPKSSDGSVEDDRSIRETFPEMHLGEPHPNKVYDNMVEEEKKSKEKLNSGSKVDNVKLRKCASCRIKENEPKAFKKCQKCKGKGTKFYCSRLCQRKDWPKHRLHHQN